MKKSALLLFVLVSLWGCAPTAPLTPLSATTTEPDNPNLYTATAPSQDGSSGTPAVTVSPHPSSQVSGIATDLLNIRAGPGITYAILGQLKQGETIAILGKSQDGLWWRIDKGWVSATYVQPSGDVSAVPVSTPSAVPTP